MKILKLLLLALLLIGGIAGVMFLNKPDTVKEPDFPNERANEWKDKIKELCSGDAWTVSGYEAIQMGMHTDRVQSNGELLSIDEESSLLDFLFASSCSYLNNGLNQLFKQDSYPDSQVGRLGSAVPFLSEESKTFPENSNFTEAEKLYNSYCRLMRLLSFNASATYSRPLKAYQGDSPDSRRASILALPYYKSHFMNNASIRSKVDTIEEEMSRAELAYYKSLEKLVEAHFKSCRNMEELLEDQIRFEEISTNPAANNELQKFVNNPRIQDED